MQINCDNTQPHNTPTTHTQHHNTHEYSPVAINTEDHTSSATVVVGDFLVAIGSSEARLPISGTSPIRFHSDMFGINSEMIRSARVRSASAYRQARPRLHACASPCCCPIRMRQPPRTVRSVSCRNAHEPGGSARKLGDWEVRGADHPQTRSKLNQFGG